MMNIQTFVLRMTNGECYGYNAETVDEAKRMAEGNGHEVEEFVRIEPANTSERGFISE